MRRILFCIVILLIVVSVVAQAQATRYTFVKNIPNDTYRTPGGNGSHGVAVDPEGKIWFMPYDVSDSVLVASTGKYAKTRAIYCWKPDGTPASFSPVKTVTVGAVTDTLWNSSRGMRADANGNVVFCSFDTYYRLNYRTGAGMSKNVANFNNTGIQPAFDSFNEMFTGLVIPKGPIKIHDNSGAFLGNVRDSADGFARSIEVSADGNDVFWAGYTNNAVYKYHSDNGSLGPYNKVDTVMVGLSVESITRHPKTGAYWASGGSAGSVDRGYRNYKWYAFAPTNLNTPIDSLSWAGSVAADPRPRGMAFSPSGDTVYVCEFGTNTVGPIQMFVKKAATQVTFWANTATVPDTLKSKSFVQIRGSASAFGPWGLSSTAILQNVAGDYWKGSFNLTPGDTIQYKFFTNANSTVGSAIGDQGWENNSTDASGNRILIVPKADTVLPLQFVNGTPTNQPQYFTPYVNQKDSIEIWFRVNMAGNESFKKDAQFMGVRGGFVGTPYDGWSKSVVLKKEDQHGNGGSRQYDGTNLWSGYVRVPKSTFASAIEYKFVIMDAASPTAGVLAWEDGIRAAPDVTGGGNRAISASPGISDTTLYWKWWANAPAIGFKGSDTVIVTFRANMSKAVAERGFTFSDTLQVRSGYGGTAKEVRTKLMTRSGITGSIFTATDTVIAAVGKNLNYQYYLIKTGNDVREVFYDFDYAGSDVSQAERRKVTVAKGMTVNDTTSTTTDMRRMPRFRNTAKVTKAVTVKYTLDLRPAYTQVARGDTLTDIQGTLHVTKSSNIKTLGVSMNGPAVGGWGSWGASLMSDTTRRMWDDATHGDAVANDTIYTRQTSYTTADFIGQEFKFGVGGGDNEGGKGGFGNNHIENIDDSQTLFILASDFGSINPKFYNTWDFNLHKAKTPTAVEDNWNGVPMVYTLDQNYPNPFNPSTTIRFTLGTEEIVTLKIFNMLGQEVTTLLHEKLSAGNHVVRFDAARLTSGVYFYQVNAGKFVETKKMLLLK
jgi:hypothetical protein